MRSPDTSIDKPEGRYCGLAFDEALTLYVDGELAFEHQPALFAHLVECAHCRHVLDGVMKFRRISRLEHLSVPASVDDAFFKRLDQHKAGSRRVDRAAERKPLWQARTPVSLRLGMMAAGVIFLLGLFIPLRAAEDNRVYQVAGEEERVEFPEPVRLHREAVYVFYPGVTVEASKAEERGETGPL